MPPINGQSSTNDVPAVQGEHTESGFGVFGKSARGVGVHGENVGGNIGPDRGVGVWGESSNGFGVFGSSDNHRGVTGISRSGVGVNGINELPAATRPKLGCGVHGESINGFGVFGASNNSAGVFAVSQGGEALHAETGAGNMAAVAAFNNSAGAGVFATSQQGEGVHGETRANGLAAIAGLNLGAGAGVFAQSEQGEGLQAHTNSPNRAALVAFVQNINGIGAALHAENKGRGPGIFAKGASLAGRFEGNVDVIGTVNTNDVRIAGADCAEEFHACESDIEPGTVMVIGDDGLLRPGCNAFDRRVAGVVSGAGEYQPGIVLHGEPNKGYFTCPLALVGKVFCKVDADFGPIRIGDMLTTSLTVGHAMAIQDPSKAVGAVIGKALRSIRAGRGLIPILVSLQ